MARPGTRRGRDERGVVFPSPVVILSIIAIVMAGVAYVATRGDDSTAQRATTVAGSEHRADAAKGDQQGHEDDEAGSGKAGSGKGEHSGKSEKKKPKRHRPAVQRDKVYVEVYNNSGITGLAGRVGGRASRAGWQVVGADNWYGSIPANTVYYPPRLKQAGKMLALDLGVARTRPAIAPMRFDRLTVVLTGELG